ncbi:hypothetical protein WJX74_009032 [Apatococcus lobatus]|uniref:DNA polymerase delta subunit 3 n=1 Tax=Apatococcus lobatus TaxID=904363 RepID=A0AAW1RFN0_9CHLO
MALANEDILQELEVVVGEELQVVSFKWLSRRYGLQVNIAKQLLFAFVERHKSKVKATYLLAGWTKSEPSQHIVRLVDQDKLLKSRETLAPVTSLHVYSIQPTQPKDPAELWNVDNGQLGQLFDDMVKLSLDNCLVDNRWGAVACPDAKRDPKLAVRPPMPARPSTTAAAPDKKSKASKGTGGGIIAAIDAVAAGATASKQGVAATSIATGPGQSQAPGAAADEPDPDIAAAPSKEAPSDQVERKPSGGSKPGPASKPPSQQSRGKGKSALASMWSKAPAKTSKAAAPSKGEQPGQQPMAGPADAEEALRQAEAGSGSNSDDELPPVRQAFLRNNSQKSAQQLEESESDEDEPRNPAQASLKQNGAAARCNSKAAAAAAPTRASGTSKSGARAGGNAPAAATSRGQAGNKRAASNRTHCQQQPEPSGSTAGGSVAGGTAKRRRVVLEDESSDEDEDEEVATGDQEGSAVDVDAPSAEPPAKGRPKGAGKARATQEAKKGKTAKRKGADSTPAASGEEGIDIDIDDTGEGGSQQDGKRKRASQKEKPVQKLGPAKAGAEQGPEGRKRRKVPRSSYNEKGEEVTEMVWEEDPDEAELGTACSTDTNSAALKELSGNEGKTKSSGKPAHSNLPAMKPAKESGASSVAAKKPLAKSAKAASKNQKGIMTFFGKK